MKSWITVIGGNTRELSTTSGLRNSKVIIVTNIITRRANKT